MHKFCIFLTACSLCCSVTSSSEKIFSSMPTLKASQPVYPYFFSSVCSKQLCHPTRKKALERRNGHERQSPREKQRLQFASNNWVTGKLCSEESRYGVRRPESCCDHEDRKGRGLSCSLVLVIRHGLARFKQKSSLP